MHNLLELIKKEQNIYNIVFHELIRQVRKPAKHFIVFYEFIRLVSETTKYFNFNELNRLVREAT